MPLTDLEPLGDHCVPGDMLELYEALEAFGVVKVARPRVRDRLRAAARPMLVPNPPNFISRAQWQARAPKERQTLTGTSGNTLHWEGPTMGVFPHSSCFPKIRGIQAFHMDSRGWNDIAYSSVVCPHGYIFEGRWYGYRTAAQGTNDGNRESFAHCFMSGSGDPFEMPAKRGIVAVFSHFEQRGSGTRRWGHRDWHSTACPGDAQYAWVHSGMHLDAPPPPPPPPPPPANQEYAVQVTVTTISRAKRATNKRAHVKKAQGLLNTWTGTSIKVDGDFGPATETAVRNLQTFFKLPVTGVVDDKTWGLLFALPF